MKKLLLIAILCAPFIGIAQVITVPQGDFETPTSTSAGVQNWSGSWFESDANDILQDASANRITGVYSCRLGNSAASRTITTANAAAFAVTQGNTYKITLKWRILDAAGASGTANAGANTFTLNVVPTSSDGTTNGTVFPLTSTQSNTDVTATANYVATSATFPKIKIQLVKSAGIAYVDDITLENLGVLPITLTSFIGEAKDYGVRLNWVTAQESNNQYFELLRAGEDKNFVSVGRVSGAVNSTTSKTYSFDDISPLKGTNYYQLKQFDTDGKSTSFNPVAVKFGLSDESFKILSTSESSVVVSISSSVVKEGVLSYIGLDGRVLHKQKVSLTSGLNSFSLPVDNSSGKIGIINFTSNGKQQTLKVFR